MILVTTGDHILNLFLQNFFKTVNIYGTQKEF